MFLVDFIFMLHNILYLCMRIKLYMNAIEKLEMQYYDEVLRLEIAYSNLKDAYERGDTDEMYRQYSAAINIPVRGFLCSVHNRTQQVISSSGLRQAEHTATVASRDKNVLRMNVEGCLLALQDEINIRDIYRNHHTYAQGVLFQPGHTFRQDEVLYQNSKKQSLKVADLLAVSKYAVSIAEAIKPDNENYAKANAAIAVLQGIDAILNNKPEDKPVNKMLHLATSFISSVVKSAVKDDEAKRGVTLTALMVDLTIDFFCK